MTMPLRIARVVLVTAVLLLVPLLAMLLTSEMQWDLFDFSVAGALIMGTGVLYEVLANRTREAKKKVLIAGGLLAVFLLIWAELAVGILH
jgi:bacteriorhodopsin